MSAAALSCGTNSARNSLDFVWLEITGRCQLSCEHCYANSGPTGTHGSMTVNQWEEVITEAAALGAKMVQFIGGEPTTHPDLPSLIHHALVSGTEVEIFSNLVRIQRDLWNVFSQPGVRLATSYYSDQASEHDRITGRRGSYLKTREGIKEAISRGIPLRAGVIGVRHDQHVSQAAQELEILGVANIGLTTCAR